MHLPAWKSEPRAQISGICGRDETRARTRAEECGVPYLGWAEMLASPDIEVVSLSVPPGIQPELICQAAAAGKHLFCEKPLGSSVDDCRRTLEAVKSSGVSVVVNHFFPKLECWRRAKSALPGLGSLRHAHLSWLLQSRAFADGIRNWKTVPGNGGGSLYNFASHSFHYLEWLFGPIERMYAKESAPPQPGLQAGVHLVLAMKQGLTVSVSIAADAVNASGHRLEVYGESGSICLVNNSGDFAKGFELKIASDGLNETMVEPLRGTGDGRVEVVKLMVKDLLDGIEGGLQIGPSLEESLRVQRLLQSADISIARGREVEVADGNA